MNLERCLSVKFTVCADVELQTLCFAWCCVAHHQQPCVFCDCISSRLHIAHALRYVESMRLEHVLEKRF